MRAVYAYRFVACVVLMALMGIPATLFGLVDRSGEAMLWFTRAYMRAVLRVCRIRVQVEGLENLPRHQPMVLMPNHQSVFDIPALVAVLPVSWRFVAKKELLWVPVLGWALFVAGHVIVDRQNRERSARSLREAGERIRRGTSVIIYPEGTRSPTGELQPFKSGGFHLAIESQVPVVPVSISGSHRVLPKRSLRIESGPIKVVFGRPIPTRGFTLDDREKLKDRVRDAILGGMDPSLQGARPERLSAAPLGRCSSA